MGDCQWEPPEGYEWMKYPGCPHEAEEGHDFCRFHLGLEEKRKDKNLTDRFADDVEKLFGAGDWDFRGFVFPDGMDMSGWDFRRAHEKEGREPKEGEKTDPVNFAIAILGNNTVFWETIFGNSANFYSTIFGVSPNFARATFSPRADFRNAIFGDSTVFWKATFGTSANFYGATFGERAYFNNATFGKRAVFKEVIGQAMAFTTKGHLMYQGKVVLEADTAMTAPAGLIFDRTAFQREANFSNTDLSKTKFQHVDLSNLSFIHSDISQTKFIACDWGEGYENKTFTEREPEKARWFRFRRPRLLQDELNWRKAKQEGKSNPTAGDIEVLALQLKQSLEATRDPIAAGDFHFAAMEMQREQVMEKYREKGKTSDWTRAAALWCYKMLNGYGERYGRALLWVFLTWLVFGVGYALLGGVSLSKDQTAGCLAGCGLGASLGRAALYSLQNLLPFKFSSNFLTVSNTTVYLLSMFETLFGTTLFTFFVLALRRRFKR